jgi:hypothetical protein
MKYLGDSVIGASPRMVDATPASRTAILGAFYWHAIEERPYARGRRTRILHVFSMANTFVCQGRYD